VRIFTARRVPALVVFMHSRDANERIAMLARNQRRPLSAVKRAHVIGRGTAVTQRRECPCEVSGIKQKAQSKWCRLPCCSLSSLCPDHSSTLPEQCLTSNVQLLAISVIPDSESVDTPRYTVRCRPICERVPVCAVVCEDALGGCSRREGIEVSGNIAAVDELWERRRKVR
jgi:hypothetical protein